jgi:hypothetical protein
MNAEEKLIRSKIFAKYYRVSPTSIAREIQTDSGIPTNPVQVLKVLQGVMKSDWIRKGIAKILSEPVDKLWSDQYRRRGAGRRPKTTG